jgi:hypothetical protein
LSNRNTAVTGCRFEHDSRVDRIAMLAGLWLCHAELHSERSVKELSRNSSRLLRSWDTQGVKTPAWLTTLRRTLAIQSSDCETFGAQPDGHSLRLPHYSTYLFCSRRGCGAGRSLHTVTDLLAAPSADETTSGAPRQSQRWTVTGERRLRARRAGK